MLEFTPNGIYCAPGKFFIDPWKPVDRAVITHAHADHARAGHDHYLCAASGTGVLRHRLGDISVEGMAYGDTIMINGVKVSFHPAGHIPGSAQIRMAHRGHVSVVSGDYKVAADGLSEAFEPVACDTFVSECTFGLPVFHWPEQDAVFAEIRQWWQVNRGDGKLSVLSAYSLGKAQRLIAGLADGDGPVFVHPTIDATNVVLRECGFPVPATRCLDPETPKQDVAGALVIVPPAASEATWIKRLGPASHGFASGWMAVRGIRRRRGVDRGFVMSDHADWSGLNQAIQATGATKVFVTHGYTGVFSQWLNTQGVDCGIVETAFSNSDDDQR